MKIQDCNIDYLLSPSDHTGKITLSERIIRLKGKLIQDVGIIPEWYVLKYESLKNSVGKPVEVRMAESFAYLLENIPIDIDDELIVGRFLKRLPTYTEEKYLKEAKNYLASQSELHLIASELHNSLHMELFLKQLQAPGYPDFESWENEGIFTIFPQYHHIAPNARKLLKIGWGGIAKEIQERLLDKKLTKKQKIFLESSLICVQAVTNFIIRYSLLAKLKQENENRKQRRKELRIIEEMCKKIAKEPATNFYEAIQLIWLQYFLMHEEISEKFYGAGIGQLDRILIDFYKRDIIENRITRDFASELIQNLFLAINIPDSRTRILPVIVGGIGPDSMDASNEITDLCLEAVEALNLLNPSIALRYHKNMSRNLLRKAVNMWGNGNGYPQMFNDEVVLPSLIKSGVSKSDIYEYIHSVCTEITVIGKTNTYISSPYFNMVKPLEFILNNGHSFLTNKKLSEVKGNLSNYQNFDDLYKDYLKEVSKWIKLSIIPHNLIEEIFKKELPQPFLSASIDNCIEKAKDYTDGGARYNNSYIQGTGISTAVDSLIILRDLVFKNGRILSDELLGALRNNFEGYQRLHALVSNYKQRYGNDVEESDQLFKHLSQFFYDEVRKYQNTRGGYYYPGFMVWESHNILGSRTGATPDGRLAGKPLSDSVGAVQGMDRNGLTALFHSVTKANYVYAVGGVTFNVRFMPSLFKSKEDKEKIIDAVISYFDLGGFHIQANVVDGAILRDAKLHPEKHQNLMVRVAGFSAYFVTLDKNIQDEIILRQEH